MKFKKDYILHFVENNISPNYNIVEEHLYVNSPFYNDNKKRLLINLDNGSWYDFKLIEYGDFISLIQKLYQFLYDEYYTRQQIILKLIKTDALNNTNKETIIKKENKDYKKLEQLFKLSKPLEQIHFKFFKERKISKNILQKYNIRFIKYDNIPFFIFPFFDIFNNLKNLQLWNFTHNKKYPKYYILGKDKIFFGLQNITNVLKIAEGVFDALTVQGVAKLGGTITKKQIQFLQYKKFDKIYLIQDNDKVGLESVQKDYKLIINNYPEYINKIYFFNWSKYKKVKDINELGYFNENDMIKFNTLNFIKFVKQVS